MCEQQLPEEIGYAKPPKSGQFKAGASGNPKGRPKGSKNLATVVLRESRQLVRVNGSGRSRKVTKLEAAVMQMGNKSAQGDPRASREFLTLVNRSEESVKASTLPANIAELDQKMIQSFPKRMNRTQDSSQTTTGEDQ